ncbi:MAG: PIN domain-containing protein [Verrucomicrobia bacterium]|jgi:predicted nucleic acid-binding protein|nr:PIN domain-containing protein [Verrucomicrobiota bacterium]
MPYLLDTNILSELRRGKRCDPNVLRWAQLTSSERHCISTLSLGEIRKGIEILKRRAPQQCPAFEDWLARLQLDYEADILPIDSIISERWGKLMAKRTLPVIDGLLAATALTHKLTVATRNIDDFKGSGVKCVNPFE